jgi:spermidine synthase
MMRKVSTVSTRFQRLEIWKSQRSVEFRVEGAVHAWFHRDRFLTGQAWDLIAAAALLRPGGPPRSIVMLGLAGGTAFRVLRHLLPECALTAVDIDGEIVELAREHMELEPLGVEVVIGDAYTWLAENRRQFDVVIDDIYLAGFEDVFRPQPMQESTVTLLRGAVAEGGLLAVNLVTGKGHRKVQSQARAMLGSAFSVVRSLGTRDAQNEVLVAGSAVRSESALDAYAASFTHEGDAQYWNRIRARKLR